jgi:hypothetical protein
MHELYPIQEHCFRFAKLIYQLVDIPDSNGKKENDRFYISWLSAADWLHVAASINDISVNTMSYDSDVILCGDGLRWEEERSEIIKNTTKLLIVFNFIWGSFENIAKIISPPEIKKSIKKRRNIVDDCLYYLKEHYPPKERIQFYDKTLTQLRESLEKHHNYKYMSSNFKLYPFCGIEGLGLHIVRMVRNDFAHGTGQIPMPPDDDEDNKHILLFRILELSARLMLMTIQMLLMAYCGDEDISVEIKNEGYRLGNALTTIHFFDQNKCTRQLSILNKYNK